MSYDAVFTEWHGEDYYNRNKGLNNIENPLCRLIAMGTRTVDTVPDLD